jgi:predicted alpha/beta superfamily hydrolase
MSTRSTFAFITALVIFCNVLNTASAQDLPGKKDSINSTILNQKRFVQVVLPSNYKPGSADKYDVVYVLDGDSNTG